MLERHRISLVLGMLLASNSASADPKPSVWLDHCRAAVDVARAQSAKLDARFDKVRPELRPAETKSDDEVVKLKVELPKPDNAGFELTVVHYAAEHPDQKPGWSDASEHTSAGPQLLLQRNGPHGHAYIVALGWSSTTLAALAALWRPAVDTCFDDRLH